jgi:hypothetical protein
MCDTLYLKTDVGFLFGKNSDRSPNEPNLVEYHPAANDASPTRRCTYIAVENVAMRRAVTIVRPSWMWGAEMGVNDAGVVIGNEAVFTNRRGKRTEHLTGMDLLRLALERAGSAKDAVSTVVALLERYGQGGNCGFDKQFYYDNSFLIAGPDGAWILETVGTEWVANAVSERGNISNALILDGPTDISSSRAGEHFARRHRDPVYTFFSKAGCRSKQASAALAVPGLDAAGMMATLQSHVDADVPRLYDRGSVRSLCMHRSALGDHTTGSLVHVFRPGVPVTWMTGCSTPCLALYKPTYFGNVVPPVFPGPEEALGFWLDREYLVRAIYAGFVDIVAYRMEAEEIQRSFLEGDLRLARKNAGVDEFHAFQKACAEREHAFVESRREAIDRIAENPIVQPGLPLPWRLKTAMLGDSVFAATLEERLAKK